MMSDHKWINSYPWSTLVSAMLPQTDTAGWNTKLRGALHRVELPIMMTSVVPEQVHSMIVHELVNFFDERELSSQYFVR